jgi:predicted negative regulator of RcsB-dependent stress response
MYDVHVDHKDSDVSVFYGTFSSLQEAQEFADTLNIDVATEQISITLVVILS